MTSLNAPLERCPLEIVMMIKDRLEIIRVKDAPKVEWHYTGQSERKKEKEVQQRLKP